MRRTVLENEAASITIPDESETRLHFGLFRLLTQRFVLTNEMAYEQPGTTPKHTSLVMTSCSISLFGELKTTPHWKPPRIVDHSIRRVEVGKRAL